MTRVAEREMPAAQCTRNTGARGGGELSEAEVVEEASHLEIRSSATEKLRGKTA